MLYDVIFDLIKNVNMPITLVASQLLLLPVRLCKINVYKVKKCSKLSFRNV